jgi:hypothetical protein
MRVAIVEVDGSIEYKDIDGSLEAMQSIVEGLIQPLDLAPDLTLWVNEEGLLLSKPLNTIATDMANAYNMESFLVGTAFQTGGVNEEGETMGLSLEREMELKFTFGRD